MKNINQQLLSTINDFTPLNPFIFNQNGLVKVENMDSYEIKRLNECVNWNELFVFFSENPNSKKEIEITENRNNPIWLLMLGQLVEFNDETCILAYIYDITNAKKKGFELERATKLRTLMLEVTQSIFIADSIEEIFDLSLGNSIKALEKSNYGTIMVKNGMFFRPVSYIGFKDDILNFNLLCEDSFLARNTDNKMDRFVRINEEQLGTQTNYKTEDEEKKKIRSTLTGPIYIEGELYGIINIDSFENNAFDDYDIQTMEFIRNNIEIAITNHKLYQEKLILSRFDNLTGLYNRHYFEEQFEIIRKRALRYNESFSVVIFDIDRFKSINDQFGHFIGDQVLKYIANKLLENQRESDIMARFGGDEFIGVLYGSNNQELYNKYSALNELLNNKQLIIDGLNIPCSFSFGISQYPNNGVTLDELVKFADFEMYKNKHSRRSA